MTFNVGLRALLRQDPDVIVIGEIRDTETLETAVQGLDEAPGPFHNSHQRRSLQLTG